MLKTFVVISDIEVVGFVPDKCGLQYVLNSVKCMKTMGVCLTSAIVYEFNRARG